jgi:hypothetical protein
MDAAQKPKNAGGMKQERICVNETGVTLSKKRK